MKARRFNSMMPRLNEAWAGQVLGMEINPQKGPDLVDGLKIIELKFCLTGRECGAERYPKDWTVLEYQMKYNGKIPAFWGLGLYEMDRAVSKIRSGNSENLEAMVLRRVLFVVQWAWMNQFSPSDTKGETRNSSWENTFRYPKLKCLPEITRTYEVKKGLVHLTQGVDPEYFSILN
jgi:hypothetical protein